MEGTHGLGMHVDTTIRGFLMVQSVVVHGQLADMLTHGHKSHVHTYRHLFNGPSSRTTRVSHYRKCKTNLDLLEQETVSGSGISLAICKSAPRRRDNSYTPNDRCEFPHHVCQARAVDVVGKWSQAVISRSDSDKCVTRLVGEVTCQQVDLLL